MSAGMILAVAIAPVYAPTKDLPSSGIITDHEVLISRATDDVLDKLSTLIRSREDGEQNLLEETLSEDEQDLFDEDHDNDAGITARRRELALGVLKNIINQVFPSNDGFGGKETELSQEVTWIWLDVGDQRRTALVTGGMSWGDSATEAMPAVTIIDALALFDEPFLRPGELPPRVMNSLELVELNDVLTETLASRGWNAETEEDDDALNELVHTIAPMQLRIDERIKSFIKDNTRG